jgi:hypothetical protein
MSDARARHVLAISPALMVTRIFDVPLRSGRDAAALFHGASLRYGGLNSRARMTRRARAARLDGAHRVGGATSPPIPKRRPVIVMVLALESTMLRRVAAIEPVVRMLVRVLEIAVQPIVLSPRHERIREVREVVLCFEARMLPPVPQPEPLVAALVPIREPRVLVTVTAADVEPRRGSVVLSRIGHGCAGRQGRGQGHER